MFWRVRQAVLCVIFLNAVNSILLARGDRDRRYGGGRLLTQLLSADGVRPDLLDGALVRPGRIDWMIYVGVPDQESRRRLLTIGLADGIWHDDVNLCDR